jgi:hypothetical protein
MLLSLSFFPTSKPIWASPWANRGEEQPSARFCLF